MAARIFTNGLIGLCLGLILLCSGCGPSETEQLKQRAETAEQELTRLKKDLASARYLLEGREEEIRIEVYTRPAWIFAGVGIIVMAIGFAIPKQNTQHYSALAVTVVSASLLTIFFLPAGKPLEYVLYAFLASFGLLALMVTIPKPSANGRAILMLTLLLSGASLTASSVLTLWPRLHPMLNLPLAGETEHAQIKQQQLTKTGQNLTARIEVAIPSFRQTLHQQLKTVVKDLTNTDSPQVQSTLAREQREIVKLILALDHYEIKCRDTLQLLSSSKRQLARLVMSRDTLGEDADKLLAQAARTEQEATVLLDTQLSKAGITAGPISDLEVENKLQQLLKEKPPEE